MTTPSKIHRPDPDSPGVAVCGRKAPPDRMTDDPAAVTCGVCVTWQVTEPGPAGPTPTIVDRLAATAHGVELDLGVDLAHDRAKTRALTVLAKKYPDEFRRAYRAELEKALTEVG